MEGNEVAQKLDRILCHFPILIWRCAILSFCCRTCAAWYMAKVVFKGTTECKHTVYVQDYKLANVVAEDVFQ